MNIRICPAKPGHAMYFLFIKAITPAFKHSPPLTFKLRFPAGF